MLTPKRRAASCASADLSLHCLVPVDTGHHRIVVLLVGNVCGFPNLREMTSVPRGSTKAACMARSQPMVGGGDLQAQSSTTAAPSSRKARSITVAWSSSSFKAAARVRFPVRRRIT